MIFTLKDFSIGKRECNRRQKNKNFKRMRASDLHISQTNDQNHFHLSMISVTNPLMFRLTVPQYNVFRDIKEH